MSYTTLPIHAPTPMQRTLMGLGAELSYEEQKAQYDSCRATNRELEQAYADAMKAWKKAKKARAAYLVEAKKVAAKNMAIDTSYASKLATYNAKMREYEVAYAQWKSKADQNQNCIQAKRDSDAQQQREAEALAREYGVTLRKTGTWWCISASTKKKMEDECAAIRQTVRGVGALNTSGLSACFLKNYPTCKYWSCPSHPGRAPTKPTPPDAKKKHYPPPKSVPEAGPEPTPPTVTDCGPAPVQPAMGIGTAGLIAVLVVGGGVVGYRWYKKRKKG